MRPPAGLCSHSRPELWSVICCSTLVSQVSLAVTCPSTPVMAWGQGTPAEARPPTKPVLQPGRPSKVGQCSFSREELEQILQERNELKANVFLLKEELSYFQR